MDNIPNYKCVLSEQIWRSFNSKVGYLRREAPMRKLFISVAALQFALSAATPDLSLLASDELGLSQTERNSGERGKQGKRKRPAPSCSSSCFIPARGRKCRAIARASHRSRPCPNGPHHGFCVPIQELAVCQSKRVPSMARVAAFVTAGKYRSSALWRRQKQP